MPFAILNALPETTIVISAFALALGLSIHKTTDPNFSLTKTTELKGLAILLIILSHIGYFLVNDHRFLTPLSNYAGVGVDIFLILSGYGLATTTRERPLSVNLFYRKRLRRLYFPVITTLLFFLTLDILWLHQTYPLKTTLINMLGIFPHADLYTDINSPLWYITLLLGYYILFPIIFKPRLAIISAGAMAALGQLIIWFISTQTHFFSPGVINLYKLHFISFPVGVLLGSCAHQFSTYVSELPSSLSKILHHQYTLIVARYTLYLSSISVLFYTYYSSSVGTSWTKEAAMSLLTSLAIIFLFHSKKFEFTFLTWFGLYSFEIYLLHWPLLYRYNFLYGKIPAGMATIASCLLLLALGFFYQKIITAFSQCLFSSAGKTTL